MRGFRWLALGASMLVLLSACSTGGSSKPTVKIGSDGFYEAKLVAEIYAQALEANGYTVDRTGIGIGTRDVSAAALESGQIDLKPEYIGSGLAFYQPGAQTGDPAANAAALQTILTGKGGGITVLNYSPAADQNAFVVTQATASTYSLSTMSDVAAVQDQLKLGLAKDCPTNPVCGQALKDAYGIDISKATLLSACDTPMVQALLGGTIDLGELCSTQPDIAANNWVRLIDDKSTQPADNLAPLVRDDYLSKLGSDKDAFEKILNDVSAKLTTDDLTQLNKQVAIDNQDISAVASGWLQANGFVQGPGAS
jgi:osmoprotectant transport system substrate-binding protein